MDRPRATRGRSWVRAAQGKGRSGVFLFLGRFTFSAIEEKGRRCRGPGVCGRSQFRERWAGRESLCVGGFACGRGQKPSLQRGDTLVVCGYRSSSLSSLQTLDTYVGRQSKRNRDVPVSPHFVYIVYHKIWRLSKMESGRKRAIWKNLGIAGDGCVGRGVWEGMEGRLGGCHLTFSS